MQLGIPLREILEFMGAINPPPAGDGNNLLQLRLRAYTTEGEPYLERFADRHLVIEVRANRMPGGGLVITFSDVTPSFEAAEALERANATLEKRVRDRTEELTRLNSELALAKGIAEDATPPRRASWLPPATTSCSRSTRRGSMSRAWSSARTAARIRGWSRISTTRSKRSRTSSARCSIFRGSMPAP